MTEAEKVALGQRVKALLADEAFLAAVDLAQDSIIAEWKAAGTTEDREACHAKRVGLEAVVTHLLSLEAQGRAISAAIERRREARREREREKRRRAE